MSTDSVPAMQITKNRMAAHWRHHLAFAGVELSLGDRAADRMRAVMGSWPFVFSFIGTMLLWASYNSIVVVRLMHGRPFDPYPYILLNLFLSMLAGLQGAILLIAGKRADSIAARLAMHTDLMATDAAKRDEWICGAIDILGGKLGFDLPPLPQLGAAS